MKETLIAVDEQYMKLFYQVYIDVCEKSEFEQSKQYIQHGDTTVYEHSINVAYRAMCMAVALGKTGHLEELVRGALLHDYFLYDWHEKDAGHKLHGFYHPQVALKNASRHFDLSKREQVIIKRHMFPLTPVPPTSVEAYLVCMADKVCSVQETFHTKEIRLRFHSIIQEAHRIRQVGWVEYSI